MKKTIAALMIGTICAASAAQAESGRLYVCWEYQASKSGAKMTLGKNWVTLNGLKYDARHYHDGTEQRWLITSTNNNHEIVLGPDGVAGYYDFTDKKRTSADFIRYCNPVR